MALRKEFEEKFLQIENNLVAKEQDLRKCIDYLKEELEIRDRAIAEKESRLQEREDVIETLQ